MTQHRDNEYHDPDGAGSLVNVLGAWRGLLAAGRDTLPLTVSFALCCSGEARANRLAQFLRRRVACAMTRVSRVSGQGRDHWKVEGTMRHEVHSLATLEHTSAWLRTAAIRHQVELIHLSLAGPGHA